MSEEKPSPITFHEYNIPTLNTWFLWSAAALLAVSLWMVWADYDREWKAYQRRFRQLEIERTRSGIGAAQKSIDARKLESSSAALKAAEQALAARRAEEAKLQDELDAHEGKWYKADQEYKFAKAELDVARYELDEARLHQHGEKEKQAAFDRVFSRVEATRLTFEEADARKSALKAQLAALTRERDEARKAIDKLTEEKSRLEGKLEKIDRSLFNDWFRDQPLVDFLAPSLKVQQAILPDVHEDVNFLSVPSVDRCQTCHLAADKPGYTDPKLPPEFRTHPRAEILLGRNHPVERFGCTSCHSGSGRAITFTDATHTPRERRDASGKVQTAAQVGQEWKQKYHWHQVEHWDFPMLPAQYTEANCANCHREESRIPGADQLNAGRQLIEDYGCFGCHKIDRPGYTELRQVGPDLAHIRGKVSETWLQKWVRDPKSFRPSTRMPRFWGNSNTEKPTPTMNWPARDNLEATAVARYVFNHSKPYAALTAPAGTGNAEKGKWVIDNRGCKACHIVGPDDTGEGRFNPDFGPNLNEVGSKLGVDWMAAWIRDPKALWAGTRMPDLRLTDQEALDAATYLATLKNPTFEALPVPPTDDAGLLDAVVYEYLRKETTTAEAKARMARMDPDGKLDYLGGKLINRYGCFGCHTGIGGFENAQQIGTELTTWASKLITKLDFGLVHLEHNKYAWLKAKLHDPRVFDQGKVESKDPQDLLKMPNFQFSPDQVERIATAVLGFQRDLIQPTGHRTLNFAQSKMERGRRLYRQYNCQGCHIIENQGGGMEKVLAGGRAYSPPVLVQEYKLADGRIGKNEEGAKVQPDWFFSFLKEPTPIRPWLEVRMPTFGLTDAEATGLVEYFSFHANQPYPYQTIDAARVSEALIGDGEALFKKNSCISCHLPLEQARAANPRAKEADIVASLAPNLELARTRLKYDWLYEWIKDPMVLQKDTKMPSGFFFMWDEEKNVHTPNFPDADRQVDALRAYLHFHPRPIYDAAPGSQARAGKP